LVPNRRQLDMNLLLVAAVRGGRVSMREREKTRSVAHDVFLPNVQLSTLLVQLFFMWNLSGESRVSNFVEPRMRSSSSFSTYLSNFPLMKLISR
jgi:hypothetical protein